MTYPRQPMNQSHERFLSKSSCLALAKRVIAFAARGGDTDIFLDSVWRGNIRWARNQMTTSGDTHANEIAISRIVKGAKNIAHTNQISDQDLERTVRRAERLLQQYAEQADEELWAPYIPPFTEPTLWFDRTYQMQAPERAEAMRQLVKPAEAAGVLSAGYIEVSAHGRAVMNERIPALYFPYTQAQYSVTVRDPGTLASGWAGMDGNDWGRIDAETVSATALEKCLRSRNPVAVEPGRYTVVLEPQAVANLVSPMLSLSVLDRYNAELSPPRSPFSSEEPGYSKIGLQVIDKRLTISADPMDPDMGFPPYTMYGDVYPPVKWIENGVLKELSYGRPYAISQLGKNTGLFNSESFRMSGGSATVESMIANTKRGVLVTRFSNIETVDFLSLLLTGVTRDGLWLIENGKISKAIKNFRFTESPFVALNNLLELGVPQRVFRPSIPTVVPALRIQDFSFTALTDAI